MARDNNGGPAFPTPRYERGEMYSLGMTLRDYFAAKAVQGFCANHNSLPERQEHFDNLAEDAYRMADAMLKARNQ